MNVTSSVISFCSCSFNSSSKLLICVVLVLGLFASCLLSRFSPVQFCGVVLVLGLFASCLLSRFSPVQFCGLFLVLGLVPSCLLV